MRRRSLGAACLVGLALVTAAWAQGTDQAVQLRYRFQPGEELRYRLTLTGDWGISFAGVTPPPGANMPGRIPTTMNGTYEFYEKVKSVSPDGAARVSVGLDKMELTTGVMGMNIVARLGPDGKLQTLMNGQPITVPNSANVSFTDPVYEATIDPTGRISGVNPDSLQSMNRLFGGQNIATMFNGLPGVGGLMLPAQPIKPGETWDTRLDLHMPIPTPGPSGPVAGAQPTGPSLPISFLIHNKLLRVEDGRAVIQTQMTASTPQGAKLPVPTPPGTGVPPGMKMSINKLTQSVTGTQRFNIDQGAVEGSDLDGTMAMAMAIGLPPGAVGAAAGSAAPKKGAGAPGAGSAARRPAAAAPTTLKVGMDGTMKMKIERVTGDQPPAAPTAPPAAPTAPPAAPQ